MGQYNINNTQIKHAAISPVMETTEQHSRLQQGLPMGLPTTKSLFTGKDGALLATVWVCFGIAVASVFSQKAAVYLGQTNQLAIVGFCLATMALVCQRQVLFAFLLHAVHSRSVSLQDVEAVLSNSVFIARSSYVCKCVLLLLMALPLGLGVAYKRFVGGFSRVEVDSHAGFFGFSSPPGYQRIGLGLTMIPQVYLPFWQNPNIGWTYGFNLLVGSNDTGAVLDIPLPDYVNMLRNDLEADEAIVITTTVNATISENVHIPSSLRQNETYWSTMTEAYPLVNLFDGFYAFFANDHVNHSIAYVSLFNQTANQIIGGQVQQNVITRRLCKGTWEITPSNMTLLDGTILETIDEARARHDQTTIENNQMEITDLFGRFVVEYDWNRYPRPRPVNTVPSLTATMVWSRLVAMCGAEVSLIDWGWANHYDKMPTDLVSHRKRTTLKESALLLVLLAVLPTMSILAAVVKICLYKCPIDDGFGLTSILAAIDPRTLSFAKGAGLSGNLSRPVAVYFTLVKSPHELKGQKIEIRLNENGPPAYLRRGTFYH